MIGDRVLPEGWRLVKFGDVVANVKATTRDPAAAGLERVVGLDHLDPESLPLRRWDLLDDLPDGTSFTRTFKAGQVLFGKRRAYQRKVAVPDFDGICSGDILVFESSTPDLLQEFLPYVVQSDGFFDHALGTSAGSLSPRTKWQELAKYEFALPSLDEQKRIGEVLDESVRALLGLETAGLAAERLWLALAQDALITGATCRLADRVDVLLGRQRHPKYAAGVHMTPYVRAANVKSGYLDLESIYEMNFDPSERLTYGLSDGDVLVSEGCGNIDEVGANAVWEGQIDDPVCFQKALIRLRAGPKTTPGLLRHWARFAFESGLFKTIARGTSIWHVSAERTRELPYPDMPIEQQKRVEVVLTHAEAVVQSVSRHCRDAERSMSHVREHLLRAEQA